MKSGKPSLLYFSRRSQDGFEATANLAGADASWRTHGSSQVSTQGRSDPCGMGAKELCIDEVPGLLSHDSS